MKESKGFTQANGSFENATLEDEKDAKESTALVAGNQEFIGDDGQHFITDIDNRQVQFCSMVPKNETEQVILFNAMNNPEKRIADCINETITVKDVFVEVVFPINAKTGEQNACPRIVLIDNNGVGYQAVSLGLYGAVRKAFSAFGTPDKWTTPKQFKVRQITKGEKKLLTLDAVVVTAKATEAKAK
jgi:hypothetical protein